MYRVLKHIIYHLLSPVSVSLWLLLISCIFLNITKSQKAGEILLLGSTLCLVAFWFPFIPDLLLGKLEQKYDQISKNSHAKSHISGIKYIIVLAGGHIFSAKLPLTSQLNWQALVRLTEGIRLFHEFPGAKLLLSGGISNAYLTDAEIMAQLTQKLGVPNSAIVLENKSTSTLQEAQYIRSIVNKDKCILVTSAFHLPRAMAVFNKLGMYPLPAPTGHLVKISRRSFYAIPNTANLVKSEIALREYIKIIKEKVLGRI